MDKVGGDAGPEDEEEKRKWDELLALPPQGSEVFIGGIPRDTTEEDLQELCEAFGEISEVRLMKDKKTKENKQFAFVTFTGKDGAQCAIEHLHDKEHKGRTLRCSLSQAKHRLFVGNVPKGLSEDELRNIIQGKGPGVVNIEMFKDLNDPSRNCRFLFVEYYNHTCADYAKQKLSAPNFKVDGSQLTIQWAEPKGSSSSDSSSAATQSYPNSGTKPRNSAFLGSSANYRYSASAAVSLFSGSNASSPDRTSRAAGDSSGKTS